MLQIKSTIFDPISQQYLTNMLNLALDHLNGRISQAVHRRQQTQLATNTTQATILLAGGNLTNHFLNDFWKKQQRIIAASSWSLARAIANGRLKTKTAITKRLNLWTNSLGAAWHYSLLFSNAAIDLKWLRGNTEDACAICLFYDGEIKPLAIWQQIALIGNVYPQGPGLECGGWNCDCRLEIV